VNPVGTEGAVEALQVVAAGYAGNHAVAEMLFIK